MCRRGFVQELCPYNATLGEHNAHLSARVSASRFYLRLESRCVSCSAAIMMCRELEKFGLTKLAPQQAHCSHRTCFKKPWNGSQFCISHLSLAANDRKAVANCIIGGFKNTFDQALQHPWSYSSSFQKMLDVRDQIADGKLPGASLLCLDLEFCAFTKTVFEIGVCEYHSGKTIIDTAVKGSIKKVSEISTSSHRDGASKRFEQEMSWKTIRSVYGGHTRSYDRGTDVHTIASQLREAHVNTRSFILVWHKNPMDLRLFRNLLEQNGCTDILPPDENCVLVLKDIQRNLPFLPSGEKLSAKLEVIFPLFFPDHDLVGRNHRALVDAQQLRLVTMAFEEACQPLANRNRTPGRVILGRKSVLDLLKKDIAI